MASRPDPWTRPMPMIGQGGSRHWRKGEFVHTTPCHLRLSVFFSDYIVLSVVYVDIYSLMILLNNVIWFVTWQALWLVCYLWVFCITWFDIMTSSTSIGPHYPKQNNVLNMNQFILGWHSLEIKVFTCTKMSMPMSVFLCLLSGVGTSKIGTT